MKLKHIALIGSLFPILFSLVLFFGVLISADSDDEEQQFFFWHYGYEFIRRSLETSAYGGKIPPENTAFPSMSMCYLLSFK